MFAVEWPDHILKVFCGVTFTLDTSYSQVGLPTHSYWIPHQYI